MKKLILIIAISLQGLGSANAQINVDFLVGAYNMTPSELKQLQSADFEWTILKQSYGWRFSQYDKVLEVGNLPTRNKIRYARYYSSNRYEWEAIERQMIAYSMKFINFDEGTFAVGANYIIIVDGAQKVDWVGFTIVRKKDREEYANYYLK